MRLLNSLKEKARKLKSDAAVLIIAYKDTRTPLIAKILIGLTVGYLLSPIDLIPDFIPVVGLLDDLIIVPALIAISIKLIPEVVLDEAREINRNGNTQYQKKNWLFAIIILIIWGIALYYAYRFIKNSF